MTVLEVINRSAEFLGKKGVESARLQSELLLAHILKIPRLKLYLQFERQLTEPEQAAMREFVRRRGAREPLQHIIGSVSFCGFEIKVSKGALIPRPETEMLAEKTWQFLDAFGGHTEFLDFGVGTGCITIAILKNAPRATAVGIETSSAALDLARENCLMNGVADRVQLLQASSFTVFPDGKKVEAIISNPPYIPSAEIEKLDPEVRDFDPRTALDGGLDGLDFYRMLARDTRNFLQPGGKIFLEFGDGQADSVKEIFQRENWIVEKIIEDYTARPRILIAAPNTPEHIPA